MKILVLCIWLFTGCLFAANAQPDSVGAAAKTDTAAHSVRSRYYSLPAIDSVALAKERLEKFREDSITMIWLKPDSLRENKFMTAIYKNNLADLGSLFNAPVKQKAYLARGAPRVFRNPWVVIVIILLLAYTALLNIFLGKDVKSVLQSFYSKQAMIQLDKEGSLINSWAFIGLFILFCLTFGLVLYQLTAYYNLSYRISGFQLFISLSLIIGLLFALKFFILKFLGFVFDINKLVSEYVTILNLTYFNIAFVLLVVGMCLSLLSGRFIPLLLLFTVVVIAVIFAWQYLRNSVTIISNFRFHKFYLFIYLCALEICPILILIKALNI